jgi:hypothetical protein
MKTRAFCNHARSDVLATAARPSLLRTCEPANLRTCEPANLRTYTRTKLFIAERKKGFYCRRTPRRDIAGQQADKCQGAGGDDQSERVGRLDAK